MGVAVGIDSKHCVPIGRFAAELDTAPAPIVIRWSLEPTPFAVSIAIRAWIHAASQTNALRLQPSVELVLELVRKLSPAMMP